MLIEIGNDIISNAEQQDEVSIETLEQLAYAQRNGKHWIYINFEQCGKICKIPYLGYIAKSIYRKIKDSIYGLDTLKQKIRQRVVISSKNPNRDGMIWINPYVHKYFKFTEETHVLAENIVDIELFEFISWFYQSQNKLKKCEISFYPLQGGGVTISDVYKNEIALGKHFCLAVADSDKKYPGGEVGSTGMKLMKLHDEVLPFNCRYYVLNNVCEIENLIPIPILKSFGNNRNHYLFNEMRHLPNLSYFDMKKGLKCCSIKCEDEYDYLFKQICNEEFLKDRMEKCHICLSGDSYNVSKDKEAGCKEQKVLIQGFGNNILKDIIQEDKSSIKGNKNKLRSVKFSDLTSEQKIEWLAIGQYIFEWCCAPRKMRV